MNRLIFMLCAIIFSPLGAAEITYVDFTKDEIQLLIQSLKNEGLSKAELEEIFHRPEVKKIPDMVTMNVTKQPPLKADVYEKFAQPPAIARAQAFQKEHAEELQKAAQAYKVDPEVIVAIALVETNLGTYTGNFPLMSIYPSVFVDSSRLLSENRVKKGEPIYPKVVAKKGWALSQLKALLKMKSRYKMDIFALKGSYAGAIGICQFLPTSFLSYAVSSGKGTPDLYKVADAVHSIGHYLKAHGYTQAIAKGGNQDHEKNQKAVYGYNHSQVYVNIVLKVAHRLKEAVRVH